MSTEKRWEIHDLITPEAGLALAAHPPILRQLLFNRGITDPEEAAQFLAAAPPDITDPRRLTGMDAAVDRIFTAIDRGESIAVYGDYDADGVTATALLMDALEALGSPALPYIPNRFEEGYGLNTEALDELKQGGVDLVVTVDCGIRAMAEADHARSIGLDLIVTDHHNPGPELPRAFAIINPKQPGDGYPEKRLAGVGVAFKLASALVQARPPAGFDIGSLLDLVAVGTVADLVPLEGENRFLVRAGLERMRTLPRQGLFSLMGVAGVQPRRVNAANIGFGLGPRLNAAGRLDTAMAAFHLLRGSGDEAGTLAQQLDNQNRERQQITREMQKRAEEIAIAEGEIPFLLFASEHSFNPGVVGLAASRLTERYYRPSVVGHDDAETTRASCRSIPEFDITAALDRCSDLLVRYGGHAAAAGFTVKNTDRKALLERLGAIAEEQLGGLDLRPVIKADAEVRLEDLTLDLLDQLEDLQPTGRGNPEPVFFARNLPVERSRTVGRDGSHLKLTLGRWPVKIDAIAFRQGHWQAEMPRAIDVIFHFERNEYAGTVSPQLNIRDLRPSI